MYSEGWLCKKDDRPQDRKSRIFIIGKEVGWSSNISTSRKTLKRLLQNKYLLDLLYHKHNAVITTATDGSIFKKIFKTRSWKTLEDITFIYSGIRKIYSGITKMKL